MKIAIILLAIFSMFMVGYLSAQQTYKNQVKLSQVCDEYMFYKKSDVPIACYDYFGIK